MITFYEPFENEYSRYTNMYACSPALTVCIAFGRFVSFRSFVCLLVCVHYFFLSNKQSVRIEFRDYGTSKITKGNSLVKHLTMYYIKHTTFPLKRDTLFMVLTSFSLVPCFGTHFYSSFACATRFSPIPVSVYYWKV